MSSLIAILAKLGTPAYLQDYLPGIHSLPFHTRGGISGLGVIADTVDAGTRLSIILPSALESGMAAHRKAESKIDAGDAVLSGWLEVPANASGVVVFAHGSGSSRFSKRNNAVARHLRDAGLATLLFDLLTAEEDRVDAVTREYRFDISLLSRRLTGATQWLIDQSSVENLPIGLFGSSTGAAAALIVAASEPQQIAAVVSRGGRADMAGDFLPHVRAPTLLIVGGADTEVLRLNRNARDKMKCIAEIAVVDRATHLFSEPGALEQVEALAGNWFLRHLRPGSA